MKMYEAHEKKDTWEKQKRTLAIEFKWASAQRNENTVTAFQVKSDTHKMSQQIVKFYKYEKQLHSNLPHTHAHIIRITIIHTFL